MLKQGNRLILTRFRNKLQTRLGLGDLQKSHRLTVQETHRQEYSSTWVRPRARNIDSSVRNNHDVSTRQFPAASRVVICGGGVLGTSLAYHLAELGWNDVTLLEQGRLTCGTTWHAAGLIGQVKGSRTETVLCQYSRDLFKKLETQGHSMGWKECGSINLARTEDRLTYFKRQKAAARCFGIETHLLSTEEVKRRVPLLRTDDILGGLIIPSDGSASPTDVVNTLSSLAKTRGVRFVEGCRVQEVVTKNNKVEKVITDHGDVHCEHFVNCAGLWARELGGRSSPVVKVPLLACEHYYMVSKPFGVDNMLPVIRDYDGCVYIREWSGGIMSGGFETTGKTIFSGDVPDKFEFQQLPEDLDQFGMLMEQAVHRIPELTNVELRQIFNGPESFTPDSGWILGEAPAVKNYYVATGMNSAGIAGSGGAGKVMAELITSGDTSIDIASMDIKRFGDCHINMDFLKNRISNESYSNHALISYPDKSFKTERCLLTSPLYTILEQTGAVFNESGGFEMPMWFNHGTAGSIVKTFGKPNWLEPVKAEQLACRSGLGLIDLSSTCKFIIQADDVEALNTYVEHICMESISTLATGGSSCTALLNKRGQYEAICDIYKVDNNRYFMLAGQPQRTHLHTWIERYLPECSNIDIQDVTQTYSVLGVIGPHSDQFMKLYNSKDVFLFKSNKSEYNLLMTSEKLLGAYNEIKTLGENFGIKDVGHKALKAVQVDMGVPTFDVDIGRKSNPFEVDPYIVVKDCDFIGKVELLQRKKARKS